MQTMTRAWLVRKLQRSTAPRLAAEFRKFSATVQGPRGSVSISHEHARRRHRSDAAVRPVPQVLPPRGRRRSGVQGEVVALSPLPRGPAREGQPEGADDTGGVAGRSAVERAELICERSSELGGADEPHDVAGAALNLARVSGNDGAALDHA